MYLHCRNMLKNGSTKNIFTRYAHLIKSYAKYAQPRDMNAVVVREGVKKNYTEKLFY